MILKKATTYILPTSLQRTGHGDNKLIKISTEPRTGGLVQSLNSFLHLVIGYFILAKMHILQIMIKHSPPDDGLPPPDDGLPPPVF